jgi:hypothetical protein
MSKETIKNTLQRWWRPTGIMNFQVLEENLIIIEFEFSKDKLKKKKKKGARRKALGFLGHIFLSRRLY